eukprot:4457263-Alexandrium_andersonii.AAC.1
MVGAQIDVEEAFLSSVARAREQANAALQRSPLQDSATMTDLPRKHQSQFYSLDSTFRIEESFFLGMVGEAGTQRLQ